MSDVYKLIAFNCCRLAVSCLQNWINYSVIYALTYMSAQSIHVALLYNKSTYSHSNTALFKPFECVRKTEGT